ncbi:hypothetical protein F4703DRAFT_1339237 [Phycomyces blakesleeanus]
MKQKERDLSKTMPLKKSTASERNIVPEYDPFPEKILPKQTDKNVSDIDNRTLVKNAVLDAFKQNMDFIDEDYLSDEDIVQDSTVADTRAVSDKGPLSTDSASRISTISNSMQSEPYPESLSRYNSTDLEPETKVKENALRQSENIYSSGILSTAPAAISTTFHEYNFEDEPAQQEPSISPLDKSLPSKDSLQADDITPRTNGEDTKRGLVVNSPSNIPVIIRKDDLSGGEKPDEEHYRISPADEIEKEKQRVSQTPSAEEMRRLSGSQRSHWSVGMNLWDTVIRRESLRGETNPRQSLATCSESDSEQWFDSQEEWMLEQAERRKSKRKSRAAAEGEAYISSDDDEEATWRPELASRAVAFEGKAAMIDKKEFVSKERLVDYDQVEEVAPKVSFDDVAQSIDSNSENNSNRRVSEDTIRENYVNRGPALEERAVVDDKGQFSSDGISVPSRGPSSSFSSHRRSMGDSLDTSPPHSPQKVSEEIFEREQQEHQQEHQQGHQKPQNQQGQQLEKVEEIQRGFGSVSVTTTAHLVTPLPKRKDPEEQVEGSTKLELGPDQAFDDPSNPHAHTLSGPILIQEKDGTPREAGMSMLVATSTPEVLPSSQQGKLYVRVNGAHNMLLPLPKEVTYVRCVVSDGRYEYMSRYEILGQQVLLDYECIVDTHPDMIVTVALHVRPDYHVKPRTGLSRWFTSIRKQKESLSGYVHPDDGAIGQTRFALPHMMHACYQKSYQSTFDCFNSWYCRSSRERQRQQQFGDEEDVLKVVGNLSIEMLYLPVSDPSLFPETCANVTWP